MLGLLGGGVGPLPPVGHVGKAYLVRPYVVSQVHHLPEVQGLPKLGLHNSVVDDEELPEAMLAAEPLSIHRVLLQSGSQGHVVPIVLDLLQVLSRYYMGYLHDVCPPTIPDRLRSA